MKSLFKKLTFIFALSIVSQNLFADIISQDSLKTHLRWKIKAQKEQIKISKKGNRISLQSLDPDFFKSFTGEVAKLSSSPDYLKKLNFSAPSVPGTPYKLDIDLKDNSIELFSFYKQESKQYILDFWINQDVIATKKASIKKKNKVVKVAKLVRSKKVNKVKISLKEDVSVSLKPKKGSRFNVIDPSEHRSSIQTSKYRDFRYGASFVWDYKALIPLLERDIDISVKTPDYLYPVVDVKNLDAKSETHMQLSINFYKKKQWGLMTRSIGLYDDRYGHDKNKVLNDYMKALAMMKNSIKSNLKPEYKSSVNEDGDIVPGKEYSSTGIMAAARSLLKNVVEESRNYELSQAVLRYLIQYSRNQKDYIQTLEYAKKLYVKSSETFDNDMIVYSSRAILNSLANLRQLNKIKDFLSNKVVLRVLPKQIGMAYIGYINLENDNSKQVIADFVSKKNKLSKPIHPSILYNTAEAYFRTGKYKKSIKTFDKFITDNSFYNESGNARLRIALSYDLLGKDHKTILKLYDDAINKSSDMGVRYEAKLRYVGLRVARNTTASDKDFETVSFLDAAKAEKQKITANHKKLLWLVRLRTLISESKYDDALAYLSTLPLDSIRLIDKRAFNGDGAEVILGMIQNAYLKNDYAKAVKVWEVYKDKYENKVVNNPYMNFIVTDSFLKLGLSKSYDRSLSYLIKLKGKSVRRFPLWVTPHKNIGLKDYIVELKLNKYLRDRDYKGLGEYLATNKSNRNINYKFYNGIVSYKLSKYTDAVKSFEELLVTPNLNNILTPSQNLQMIETYLEALYEKAKPAKFRKNAAALVNDLRLSKNTQYKKLVERADYLYLESLFSENSTNYKLLSMKTGEFVGEYKKSNYISRVEYLRGVSLVNTNQQIEGKKVLNELLSREGIPGYLKSLVRSELSTLELKNKTL
jgi:hypothetical protein